MDATSIRCREASFNGADGVVAHKLCFAMRFLDVSCERPPRPRLSERDHFFAGEATPPHEEGNNPVSRIVRDTKPNLPQYWKPWSM